MWMVVIDLFHLHEYPIFDILLPRGVLTKNSKLSNLACNVFFKQPPKKKMISLFRLMFIVNMKVTSNFSSFGFINQKFCKNEVL